MIFSREFLEDVVERVVLSSVVARYVRLKKQGQSVTGLCPFHQESTPSFHVNDLKKFYHCFGCQAHGNVFTFVQQKEKIGFVEAVKKVCHDHGLSLPKERTLSPPDQQRQEPLFQALRAACLFFRSALKSSRSAQNYLINRGITPETAAAFDIGFAPKGNALKTHLLRQGYSEKVLRDTGLLGYNDTKQETYDWFRNRIIFPIFDVKKRVVGFGGRILGEGQPKYLNSPETPCFHKGRQLYNLTGVMRITPSNPLILVEGYTDVIAMHHAGFTNTTAPLGTALTLDQINLLWRRSSEPILCFDGDIPGYKAAHRAASMVMPVLFAGKTLKFIFLPKDQDPDTYLKHFGADAFSKLCQNPYGLVDILWRFDVLSHSLDTPEKKAQLQKQLFLKINTIPDVNVKTHFRQTFNGLFRQLYVNKKPQTVGEPLRKAPLSPVILQHKILFAVILNYPMILNDVIEEWLCLSPPAPELVKLRDGIVEYYENNYESLDKEQIVNHLSTCYELDNIINDVLSDKIYLHASFAQPNQSMDSVRSGWQEIMQRLHYNSNLDEQVKGIEDHLKQELNTSNWQKFQKIRQELL